MNKKRIQYIIEKLGLQRHPEGGYYAETYRSSEKIDSLNRNVQTSIYFLLTSNDISKFHRIKSDEIWFYHEGANINIHTLDAFGHKVHNLGPLSEDGNVPQIVIPKNTIFGATVTNSNNYTLVSCTVAPGFDFEDFELMNRAQLLSDFPGYEEIIYRLT